MALLERLQILVDGNASGAIREFQKVGAAADRELGRTEDKLAKISNQLTSFGTGLLAGSAVAAVGLSKLATAASDYGEAVNKATVILGGESVKQLEDFAGAASKTAGISKTAALDAAAGFGALGKQAGLTGEPLAKFSTDLVQLAGDLASFNNTTVDESLQALKSGLQGESEPLKRFNIFLNDAALKQELFALTGEKVSGTLTTQQKIVAANSLIFKQASDATGDFERTSDSLANQQRTLQADFENLKTEIGQGLVPTFSTIVGAIGGVVGAFGTLPTGVQTGIGSLAGIATVAGGVVGAFSLVAGQVIKMREAFTTLKPGATTAQLTNLGKAAGVAGAAGGIIALGLALREGIEAAADFGPEIEEILALLNNTPTDPKAIENTLRQLDAASGAFAPAYEEAKKAFDTIEQLARDNPEAARQYINRLRTEVDDYVAALVKSGEFTSSEARVQERQLRKNLDTAEERVNAVEKQTVAEEKFSGAAAVTNDKLEEQEKGFDQTKQALDKYAERTAFLTVNYESLAKRADEFTAAIERSTRLDDEIQSAASLGGALSDVRKNIGNLPKEIDTAKLAFGGYNEEQLKSIDALLKLGDASGQFLESLFQQNYTIDEIRFAAGILREEYTKQFEQLGLNEEQVDKYLTVLGLTPDQVDTAITLSGEQEARFKIEAYQALIEGTPPEKLTEFYAELAEGDYIAAAQKLDELAKDRTAVVTIEQRLAFTQTVPGAAATTASAYDILAWRALGGDQAAAAALNALGAVGAAGGSGAGFPQRARGGPVAANRMYMVGEEGPEMFVPRTSGTIVPNGQLQGGTMNLTQNITTGDPILTAAEVVRRQRDAEFLAGV
jgi:hypothetical protein